MLGYKSKDRYRYDLIRKLLRIFNYRSILMETHENKKTRIIIGSLEFLRKT